MEAYGVLAQTVAVAGTLIAAGAALLLTWKGRFGWEPVQEDVPRGAQKVGGLLTAVCIAVLWYTFAIQREFVANDLKGISLLCVGVALVSLMCYGLLIGMLVYDKEVVIAPQKTAVVKVIGGFWLSGYAKVVQLENQLTVQELIKGAANDLDKVWDRPSRALSKVVFQFTYIALTASGTLALASISMLVGSTL